jgi:homoserine O-acetyltransferase
VASAALATKLLEESVVQEGIAALGASFALHHGGALLNASMAYRLRGPIDAPVIIAVGGISGNRFVAQEDEGWWKALVGPQLAIDTERFRILGIDYLGGSGDSTTTVAGEAFPTISAYDQAEALVHVLNALKINTVHAVVGASYGGLVAMALAKKHPSRMKQVIAISVGAKAHPHSSAIRAVERELVRFALKHHDGEEGLKLARSLAMCTYRSKREFKQRFSGEPRQSDGRLRLPVEDYIFSRGDAYVKKYKAEGFLALSESIDLFTINGADIGLPITVIGVGEDELVPVADCEALARSCPLGQWVRIESSYGHDAFLKETQMFIDCLAPRLALA